MIEPPEIVETSPQVMAFIHLTIPREMVRKAMDPAIHEVLAALLEQGLEPCGPWCTHHLVIDPDVFDFQICFPVERPVEPVGRVQCGEWPAMRVARTRYNGPYGGLAKAWQEFNEWMAANGYRGAEDLWERYVSSPPRARCTELNRPLV